MNSRRDILLKLMTIAVLVVCAGAALSINIDRPTNAATNGSSAIANAPVEANPAFEVANNRHLLEGKTPKEIAEYAVQTYAPMLGSEDHTEILLSRLITRKELPQLGLGCLPENVSSEEPPYVLVILKGNFDMRGIPMRVRSDKQHSHVALVIDVWAAQPTTVIGSPNGGIFRIALNDLSLPEVDEQFPKDCPAWKPGKAPHGAILPGIVFPTSLPEPTPIATPIVPLPVPTGEVK